MKTCPPTGSTMPALATGRSGTSQEMAAALVSPLLRSRARGQSAPSNRLKSSIAHQCSSPVTLEGQRLPQSLRHISGMIDHMPPSDALARGVYRSR